MTMHMRRLIKLCETDSSNDGREWFHGSGVGGIAVFRPGSDGMIWGSESEEDALDYNPKFLYTLSLNVRNPAAIEDEGEAKSIAEAAVLSEYPSADLSDFSYMEFLECDGVIPALRKAGYDGITIHHYVFDCEHLGAFDGSQVKVLSCEKV